PTVEVDLCGHATLASAYILFELEAVDPNAPITFHTRSGALTTSRSRDGIELNFPALKVKPIAESTSSMQDVLRTEGIMFAGKGIYDYLVELPSEAAVRDLAPDFAKIVRLGMRGLIATARADSSSPYDFISRCFFPASGIEEDPVTGSAHCLLGPYW